MIAVGITDVIDDEFLRDLSGSKNTLPGSQMLNKDYFKSPDFLSLNSITSSIVGSTCKQPIPSKNMN